MLLIVPNFLGNKHGQIEEGRRGSNPQSAIKTRNQNQRHFFYMNSLRNRILLVLITGFMVLTLCGASIYKLYQTAINEAGQRLEEIVCVRAELIDAVARFDAVHSPNFPAGAPSATLSQLRNAHQKSKGFGKTGQFLLARRDGTNIVFLLHETEEQRAVLFDSDLAEPLRLAISGEKGLLIGLDYRGNKVMAAYHPIPFLAMGLVAEIDLAEVQTPYIKTAITAFTSILFALSAAIFILGKTLFKLQETNEELHANREQFRAISEGINSALFLMDDSGMTKYLNPAASKIFGYSEKEALGQNLHSLLVPNDCQQAFHNNFSHFCQTGLGPAVGRVMELDAVRKNGQRFPVELSFSSFQIAGRWHAAGVVTDISERKQAEQAQKDYLDLANIVDFSFNEIYIFSADNFLFEFANPAAINNTGYSLAELRMLTPYDIKPEFTREGFRKVVAPLDMGEVGGLFFETTHKRKDGSCYPAEVHLQLSVYKGQQVYAAFVVDISKRKQAEQKRELLQSAIEQAAETIVITDKQGSIQYVNPAFELITGYPRTEAIGQNPRILKSGEHDNAFYRAMWDELTGGNSWSGRLINKKKDGTFYTEEATISPVHDAAGEIVNFVAVKRDISQEIALETQLRLVQKLEVVGTLASGIAHDFNNILAPIIGYTQLMQEEKGRPEQDYDRLSVIMSSARRAKELVEQILNFSRQAEDNLQPLSLKNQVEETVMLLRTSTPATIDFSLDLQDLQVLASTSHVHQVVLNLYNNAAYAMRKTGGTLTIRLEQTELETGNLSLLSPGSYALLSIHDSGPGIAPEVLPHIFEPYFTTKDVGEGSGIGLATVQRIVVSLGGNISAESAPNQGCTFFILLPITQSGKVAKKQITPIDLPEGDKHLLLVDDEEALVGISSEFLQDLGYRVTGFTSSKEALQEFAQRPDEYDLLITDLTMPELDGIELSQEINKIRPALPVILCTGQKPLLPKQNLDDFNLLKTLQKPDLFAELAFSIHQHFNG